MMQHKKKIRTGFTAILLSALFLCNPVVAFLDILPNSIGYLLLCFGLHRLADLSARLTDALRRFRILLLLSVAQLLAVYLIYGVMAGQASQMNPYEQPVYILLGSFVMLFFQWYYLIPAFGDLFGGIDHLADKHSADALTQTKRNKTPAERMKRSASVFVIARSLLAFLPELTILTSFENDVGNQFFPFDWYEFIGVLRILCFAVSLIFSLVCLVRMITFGRSAKRDGEWIERLEAQYSEDVLPQTGMLTVRRFSLALFLVQLGLIFTVNLRMNGYAVLPGCGFALLVAWAIFY